MARTYLQPCYDNEVFGNVYLSAGQHLEINIAVMGVVDTFGHKLICAKEKLTIPIWTVTQLKSM